MNSTAEIEVVVPGLILNMENLQPLDFPGLNELERALGRARCSGEILPARYEQGEQGDIRDIVQHFHQTLMQRFSAPAQEPDNSLSIAPYRYLADTHQSPSCSILAMDPVHLRPEQDRLVLYSATRFGISQNEADALVGLFNDHFADRNLTLIAPTPGRWYLLNSPSPAICTTPLYEVEGRNVNLALPSGVDAQFWNSVLNETQMLFFQAEVNQVREASGRTTINGVWPHSGGQLPQQSLHNPFDTVYANDPLICGLVEQSGGTALSVQNIIFPKKGNCLVVLDQLIESALAQEPQDWLTELEAITGQLLLLLDWAMAGTGKLILNPCDGRLFELDKMAGWRFWRRRKRLEQLAL